MEVNTGSTWIHEGYVVPAAKSAVGGGVTHYAGPAGEDVTALNDVELKPGCCLTMWISVKLYLIVFLEQHL